MAILRMAVDDDAGFMVPLIAESSGGVWPAVWKALNTEREPAATHAQTYLTNPSNKLGIDNSVIAEIDGQPVGMMVLYQEDEQPSAQDTKSASTLPLSLWNALQPYRQLSDPDSLFIAEVCLLPESRGRGVGTLFLDFAKTHAKELGLARVSLRVFSTNTAAVRLYQKSGFQITGTRSVLPHPDISIQGNVYLMTCAI